jgi:hypothetical protein
MRIFLVAVLLAVLGLAAGQNIVAHIVPHSHDDGLHPSPSALIGFVATKRPLSELLIFKPKHFISFSFGLV